jgi:hypothetical protein
MSPIAAAVAGGEAPGERGSLRPPSFPGVAGNEKARSRSGGKVQDGRWTLLGFSVSPLLASFDPCSLDGVGNRRVGDGLNQVPHEEIKELFGCIAGVLRFRHQDVTSWRASTDVARALGEARSRRGHAFPSMWKRCFSRSAFRHLRGVGFSTDALLHLGRG